MLDIQGFFKVSFLDGCLVNRFLFTQGNRPHPSQVTPIVSQEGLQVLFVSDDFEAPGKPGWRTAPVSITRSSFLR